jgi:hypothetical protein
MVRRLAPGVILILFSFAFAASAADISTLTFFSQPAFKLVRISPDGHYLAVVGPVKGEDEKYQLDFIDLGTMKLKGHLGLVGEQQIADLWWANDKRVVFTTAT